MGKIITFFSYKGGVGRSMALANVGVRLAQWGHRVLMVDWDLGAPGLESFFRRYVDLDSVKDQDGVLDLLTYDPREAAEVAERSAWADFVTNIDPSPSLPAPLHLLTAGRRDSQYYQKVRGLDVQTLYSQKAGGLFIEALRDSWKKSYDFILIDSRTGVTDIGGICTVQLPDMLVLLFTATEQAFTGSLEIARKSAAARQRLPYERLRIPAVPIPSRFDTQNEFELSQQWLNRFARELVELYADWLPTSVSRREILEVTKLPYLSYFSFGEGLPVLEQGTNDPAGLGYAYENLAALVASDLQNVELLLEDRDDFLKTARFRKRDRKAKIVMLYSDKDRKWVERLDRHLGAQRRLHPTELWSDQDVAVGHSWYPDFQEALESAAVVIAMISPNFLSSSFVDRDEVIRLLTKSEQEGLPIVPVIVRPADWQAVSWLAGRQTLPATGGPLTSSPEADTESVLAAAATEIRFLAQARAFRAHGDRSGLESLARENLLGQSNEQGGEKHRFDVFLNHNSEDRPAARKLAIALKKLGLRVWFDEWELPPGSRWQNAVEEGMTACKAIVVLLGESGIGPWQELEIQTLLARANSRGQAVIPILLPGAGPADFQKLPLFLSQLTSVDLRDGLSPEGLSRLKWGIVGHKP